MDILTVNWLIGVGTVLMQIAVVALVALFFVRDQKMESLVLRFALPGAFLLSLIGVVMSLIYSEYFGLVPCSLCWITRIFLFPQAIFFGIAALKKDTKIAVYSLALSIPGVLVGLYQHYLQMGGTSVLPCPASGEADCAKRFLFEFGYITFPLVGATTFILLGVLMAFLIRAERNARV